MVCPSGGGRVERLQRYLARSGVASRRAAEKLILSGVVAVNGRPVTVLGSKVEASDLVTVEGRPVAPPVALTYLMLHKPSGYVTTMRDPQGRPRVIDLLPAGGPRVYPVGRLDFESTGLLLLTNDGDLAQSLLHPSKGVWKTYLAKVVGHPAEQVLARLRGGITLADGVTAPAGVQILGREDGYATLEIRLHEGRKRQVRRMLAAVGHPVVTLARVEFGPLKLGGLPGGSWRLLTDGEIEALRQVARLEQRPSPKAGKVRR